MERDYPTQVCVHPREVKSAETRLPLLVLLAPARPPVILEGRIDIERIYRELSALGLDE